MSNISVWEERDGESRNDPEGEREREVGVFVCPVRVEMTACLRRS